jgi:tetratricopeptide (TPR) repeat protein
MCHAERGEFTEGAACAKEGIRIAEEIGDPFSLLASNFGAGFLRLQKGEVAEAIPLLEFSLESCHMGSIRIWLPWVAANTGFAYVLSERTSDGLTLLEQAVDHAASIGLMSQMSLWVARLGEAHLLAGQIVEARKHAGRALDFSRKHKERGSEAWALRLLGEIHSHPDSLDAEKAEENYLQALALAEEIGMRPLIAHCRKGLGALYGQTGREEKGREELTAAMDMYREMEMTFWLEKAEKAMAEAG